MLIDSTRLPLALKQARRKATVMQRLRNVAAELLRLFW